MAVAAGESAMVVECGTSSDVIDTEDGIEGMEDGDLETCLSISRCGLMCRSRQLPAETGVRPSKDWVRDQITKTEQLNGWTAGPLTPQAVDKVRNL